MALNEVTTTGNVRDYFAHEFDVRRAKAWATTNVDALHDTSTGETRIGGGTATIESDGTVEFTHWAPGADGNPISWQTTYHFDVPDRTAPKGRRQKSFGPFTVTTTGLLTALVEEQEVPPTYLTTVTTLLDGYVTAAQTAETNAEAAAALATDISNIDTSDALVETLVSNPASLTAVALSTTLAPVAGRGLAGRSGAAPDSLTPTYLDGSAVTSLIGLLPDGERKVFTNAGFSAGQIGSSVDGVSFTWGKNFGGGNGLTKRLLIAPDGEALVAVQYRDNTPGQIFRATGWNPVTMDATSWAAVLTASATGATFDGRWGFTQRSIAPTSSLEPDAIYASEYAGTKAYRSTDSGATWVGIFDLTTYQAADHIHGIAHDPYDDRVLITVGDNANSGIYYANVEDLPGATWALVPGTDTNAAQTTTIIPMSSALVLLSDASDSAIFRIPRATYREYGTVDVALDLTGTGMIGDCAYQASAADPAYFTFYSVAGGETPGIWASNDGATFAKVHAEAAAVAGGPGVVSVIGPDVEGRVWATRNMTGASQDILRTPARSNYRPRSEAADRMGLIAQTFPAFTSQANSAALTNGTLYVFKVRAEKDSDNGTRNVRLWQVGAATGLTSFEAAVYDSTGTQLGATSASDPGSGTSKRDLAVGTFPLTEGADYYVALLFVGTTGPTFARTQQSDGRVNAGLTGASLLFATGGTALAAIPSSITPGSLSNSSNIALWVGLL